MLNTTEQQKTKRYYSRRFTLTIQKSNKDTLALAVGLKTRALLVQRGEQDLKLTRQHRVHLCVLLQPSVYKCQN